MSNHDHKHDHSHEEHEHEDHDHADHSHGHGHSHAPESYNLAFALATLLNFAFVVIEGGYAVYANSMSLLADAAHNLGDVVGLLLAWGATWLLTRKVGRRYSYGHKKTSVLAALINALILLSTSVLIIRESIEKLLHPGQVNEMVVIVVALIGIAINGSTALMFMRGRHDDLNIKAAFMHLAYDTLISFSVVIVGIILLSTGWTILDPLVGLAIVAVMLAGTWGLLRDSVNLILDAVPHGIDHRKVEQYFASMHGVDAVHDLHIWGLSTRDTALTVHLIMPDHALTDDDYHEINQHLFSKFKISHMTIQVEKGHEDYTCQTTEICR